MITNIEDCKKIIEKCKEEAGKRLSEKADGNAAASDDEEILSELGRL